MGARTTPYRAPWTVTCQRSMDDRPWNDIMLICTQESPEFSQLVIASEDDLI